MRAIRAPEISDSLRIRTIHLVVQLLQKLSALLGAEFALQFLKRQCDGVVVVRSRKFGVGGDVKPELMHEFDILRAHARGVGAEGVLAHGAIRSGNLQRQAGAWLSETLPRIAGQLGLLVGSELVGKTADDAAGIK